MFMGLKKLKNFERLSIFYFIFFDVNGRNDVNGRFSFFWLVYVCVFV
jgi:hypothetical protein